jgi:hypothetical protein
MHGSRHSRPCWVLYCLETTTCHPDKAQNSPEEKHLSNGNLRKEAKHAEVMLSIVEKKNKIHYISKAISKY